MKLVLSAFAAGLLFALGLGVAGMTRPTKVLGFLDLAGAWDPSLMLVMVGGIAVFAAAFRVVKMRGSACGGEPLHLPPKGRVDARLVGGAALFGVGWGLAGFCPGPALVGAAAMAPDAVLFLIAMLIGQVAFQLTAGDARLPAKNAEPGGGHAN